MINSLDDYCKLWNLKINLDKSKVLVFRNGGRSSKNEKWVLGAQRIEVVNEYKYLGMILTPTLPMTKQLKTKLSKAKMTLNTVWHQFIENKNITYSTKIRILSVDP